MGPLRFLSLTVFVVFPAAWSKRFAFKILATAMDGFIVLKFNLQKGDLIRPGQVLFLLFLQISLFILI